MLASAVERYNTHTGTLPSRVTDLTSPVKNREGLVAGPFLDSVPTSPRGWTDYRYEARADGTFFLTTSGDDRMVCLGWPCTQRIPSLSPAR